MSKYRNVGCEIGELVDQKNEAYGSSFEKSGEFLRLLFPEGVPPDRFDDALLLVRIWDKQMRIATDRDAFGESPYRDIAGYGLLGAVMHEERKSSTCGTARADADTQQKAMPASALASASPATTPLAKQPSERLSESKSSPQPASCWPIAGSVDVCARSATDAVRKSVAGLKKQLDRDARAQEGRP